MQGYNKQAEHQTDRRMNQIQSFNTLISTFLKIPTHTHSVRNAMVDAGEYYRSWQKWMEVRLHVRCVVLADTFPASRALLHMKNKVITI